MPRWLTSFKEQSMSGCSPLGISTPITLSLPKASTQRAAVTELSLPPEIPTTALQSGPYYSKNFFIHSTHSFLILTLTVLRAFPNLYWLYSTINRPHIYMTTSRNTIRTSEIKDRPVYTQAVFCLSSTISALPHYIVLLI